MSSVGNWIIYRLICNISNFFCILTLTGFMLSANILAYIILVQWLVARLLTPYAVVYFLPMASRSWLNGPGCESRWIQLQCGTLIATHIILPTNTEFLPGLLICHPPAMTMATEASFWGDFSFAYGKQGRFGIPRPPLSHTQSGAGPADYLGHS